MRVRSPAPVAALAALLATVAVLSGCGAAGTTSTAARQTPHAPTPASARSSAGAPAHTARLHVSGVASLPEPRSGGAAAATSQGTVTVSGGLSAAGASTATVFGLAPGHPSSVIGTLPGPVHDAAAATLAGQLLLFGGGQSEGSDRVIRVLPAPARVIGHLPQALSDLVAVTIPPYMYVVGGYNGTTTSRDILRATPAGAVTRVGSLALGVRYPAAATDGAGHIIVAGGETDSGTPTDTAWSFDTRTGTLTRLPPLPAPTDHAPGAWLDGRFYLLGGLRRGAFTSTILSWAPGEPHWRVAGHLSVAVADAAAASTGSTIAVLGGRDASGASAQVSLLSAS